MEGEISVINYNLEEIMILKLLSSIQIGTLHQQDSNHAKASELTIKI
jgi:hypothetical protein